MAAFGLGRRKDARAHLFDALDIVVEISAFIPLLDVLPVIPVVLVNEQEGQADPRLMERALELYALARTQPYIAKSQLIEDVAGQHIKAATAILPPEVIEAAHERGRALDWWQTAEGLLAELRDLGWASPAEPGAM
jgi:hypothetical protein